MQEYILCGVLNDVIYETNFVYIESSESTETLKRNFPFVASKQYLNNL